MMPNVWFTSDHHFGHRNLVEKIADRPFSSIEEMDEELIRRWNFLVHPRDLVYHLGDFAWQSVAIYADRLNGTKQLIKGNHDREKDSKYREYFAWVGDYKRIKFHDRKLTLFHYPILSWQGKHRGDWHLYGHTHNSIIPLIGSCEVSVDAWNYYPISFDQLDEYFLVQKEVIKTMVLNTKPCNDYACARCGDLE